MPGNRAGRLQLIVAALHLRARERDPVVRLRDLQRHVVDGKRLRAQIFGGDGRGRVELVKPRHRMLRLEIFRRDDIRLDGIDAKAAVNHRRRAQVQIPVQFVVANFRRAGNRRAARRRHRHRRRERREIEIVAGELEMRRAAQQVARLRWQLHRSFHRHSHAGARQRRGLQCRHAVEHGKVHARFVESDVIDAQIVRVAAAGGSPRTRRAEQTDEIEIELIDDALRGNGGKNADLLRRRERESGRREMRFDEQRALFLLQLRFHFHRRAVKQRAHAQVELARVYLRSIDLDERETRGAIEHDIAQHEIAIFVARRSGHARPRFARRQLQQRNAQRARRARIQLHVGVFHHEIVQRREQNGPVKNDEQRKKSAATRGRRLRRTVPP